MTDLIIKIHKYGFVELDECKIAGRVFITSDQHFDHRNIIMLCDRPYVSVDEMNQSLIDNWNDTVPEDGLVFILGDFCWTDSGKRWKDLLDKLNGEKILIKGNHDNYKVLENIEDSFITIRERLEVRVGNMRVMLDHYPMKEWSGSYHNVKSIYGHIHEKDFPDAKCSQYNVSVERNNYRPISWEEMILIFDEQKNKGHGNLWLKDLYGSTH